MKSLVYKSKLSHNLRIENAYLDVYLSDWYHRPMDNFFDNDAVIDLENQYLVRNDFERYEVYVHNQAVLAASSLSVALQEYRSSIRQLSSHERYSSIVRIYDNITKKWIR